MPSPTLTLEIRKAKDGFRWRMIRSNGRIIAESGEAYQRKATLKRTLSRLVDSLAHKRFKIEE